MKTSCQILIILSLLVIHAKSLTSSHNSEKHRRAVEESSSTNENQVETGPPKLMVIMLDGFRWDYYNKNKKDMVAFEQFLSEGVQAKWVEPIFPAISYPSWTTIGTGLFPESHGILGNYMYNKKTRNSFDLFLPNTTTQPEWWQHAEPIWITATKANKNAFLRYWARCDVPFERIYPKECSGFRVDRGAQAVVDTFDTAVRKIKDYDLVMVYNEHIDNLGHKYGPDSPELKQGLKDVNQALMGLLDTIYDDEELEDKVNIIIISDHGMIGTGPDTNTTYLELQRYLNPAEVSKVLDRCAVVAIDPYVQTLEQVYQKLKANMPGVDVYKKEEIPENFHYKNSHLAHDILVVAKRGYFIRGIQDARKQLPLDKAEFEYWGGIHGYPDMEEMRTIFFAKGPAFKKGIVHPPIRLEDIYQVFASVLEIQPQPHNGSWERVASMFINTSAILSCSVYVQIISFLTLLCTLYRI